MKKIVFLLMMAAFAHDIVVDSFDACGVAENSQTCQCLCQTHFTAPAPVTELKENTTIERMASKTDVVLNPILATSLFRPPKALA